MSKWLWVCVCVCVRSSLRLPEGAVHFSAVYKWLFDCSTLCVAVSLYRLPCIGCVPVTAGVLRCFFNCPHVGFVLILSIWCWEILLIWKDMLSDVHGLCGITPLAFLSPVLLWSPLSHLCAVYLLWKYSPIKYGMFGLHHQIFLCEYWAVLPEFLY